MENEEPEPPRDREVDWDRVIAIASLGISLLAWLFPREG